MAAIPFDAVAFAQSPAVAGTLDHHLAAGTPIVVTLVDDVSSATGKVGDRFQVSVARDVAVDGAVAVAHGTVGHGQITFVSRRGGFGKAGILVLTLRDLTIGEKSFALDGHYEEDGKKRHNTAAATMFAAGLLSLTVHGGEAIVPKGRELVARTGQDIPYAIDPQPEPAVSDPAAAVQSPGKQQRISQ